MKNYVECWCYGTDGYLKHYEKSENLVVNEGLNLVTDLAFSGSQTTVEVRYCETGDSNTAPSASDTGIQGSQMHLKTSYDSIVDVGTGVRKMWFSWTTGATGTVREAVLWENAYQYILARVVFSDISYVSGQDFYIAWTVTYTND